MTVNELSINEQFTIGGIQFKVIEHHTTYTLCTDSTGSQIQLLNMKIDNENTQIDRDPTQL